MPAKKNPGATGTEENPIGLTDGELRFIKAIFDNMTQKPDADWTKVASDLGLKDSKCAKERFRQMSQRHGWREQVASPSPRKGRNGVTGASGDGKITKKPRKSLVKKAKKEESEDEVVKRKDEDVKDEGGSTDEMET